MKYLFIILVSLNVHAESVNLSLFGLTMHGEAPESNAYEKMDRKIDKKGVFAQHIEFNLTYTADNDVFINATMLKDCFDNTAYFIGLGKQWEIEKNLYWSVSAGIYVKQNVERVAIMGSKVGNMEYLPLPWIGVKKIIPLSDNFGLTAQVNTNVFLTHATFGLEYSIP